MLDQRGAAISEVHVDVASVTDTGRRRVNADALLCDPVADFYGVADGMGDTTRSGAVARMALEAVRELFLAPWSALPREVRAPSEALERLTLGIMQANDRLYRPRRPAAQRVGTTFAGVVLCDDIVCVAHLGDSRVGLVRRHDGRLSALTVDHTVQAEAHGPSADPRLAGLEPHPAALTRAIGRRPSVTPALRRARWEPGDVLVLSTDGVTDHVDNETIERILTETSDLVWAAMRIVGGAVERGGRDNASVILVRRRGTDDDERGPKVGVGMRARRG